MTVSMRNPWWTIIVPACTLALAIFLELRFHDALPMAMFVLALPFLFASVFSAVHQAEVAAHKIGQPFGSILLALAVTVIEVSLIVSVLLSAPAGESAIARDTVFAAIMIVLNGIVGICLLVGGIRYHHQDFRPQSATAALAVLCTLAVLALILPNFTKTIPGPVYAPTQLVFVAVVSLALYGLFLYVQTVSHRADFLDSDAETNTVHATVPRNVFIVALVMLPVSLVGVVLLAEILAGVLEIGIERAGLPTAVVGVVIALIVLLPEGLASVRAARSNRLQTSLNLALGSAIASVSLTIPTVALISLWMGQTLVLGLAAEHIALLVLSLFISTLSLALGRTTVLQGGIHLVIFAAFLTVSAIP